MDSNDIQQPVSGAPTTLPVPSQPTQNQPTSQPTPVPPSVFPAAQPQPPANNQQQPSDDDSAQPKPSLHARIFDRILKGMSGGDIKVVAPDGSVQTVPQSRTSMGKSIVAAALTGLMTPTHYRDTPYGPVVDYGNTMADALQRGNAAQQQRQQQAQQLSDEQQARNPQRPATLPVTFLAWTPRARSRFPASMALPASPDPRGSSLSAQLLTARDQPRSE
jgi:hypothetical protein